jgi:hypothetical protein
MNRKTLGSNLLQTGHLGFPAKTESLRLSSWSTSMFATRSTNEEMRLLESALQAFRWPRD